MIRCHLSFERRVSDLNLCPLSGLQLSSVFARTSSSFGGNLVTFRSEGHIGSTHAVLAAASIVRCFPGRCCLFAQHRA